MRLYTHTHTHTHCLLVNGNSLICNVINLKLYRFFRGSTTHLLFWQGDAGLSFSALFESVCGIAASGLKVRYGPFVSFRNYFIDSKENYEGSCFI